MDNSSIPINGDEGLASLQGLNSLQIVCDLGASSESLTCASSTLTTPKSDRTGNWGDASNNNEGPSSEWKELYERLNRTPPKATRDAPYPKTVATANKLLEQSDDPDFQKKSFEDLSHNQQAILMLMVLKRMENNIIEGGIDKSAKVLIKALNPTSPEYKRMMSFVRKGGDIHCPTASSLHRKAWQQIKQFVSLRNATTIFKDRPTMKPLLYLQRDDSYVCTFNACAGLLYYCTNNSSSGENEKTLRMNISRYIRDEVSGLEIANFTLTDMKGAYLGRVLLGLLKSFGTGECHAVEPIRTWDNEDDTYYQLKVYLNNGCPFVFVIECFDDLADLRRTEYTGKVADLYKGTNKRPKSPEERSYHALLCIGITPREGPQLPPMLLVQDSCSGRPVFKIGLDLLMDFGMDSLEMCTVPKHWKFNEKMNYVARPDAKALFCGSPMSFDDNGVPRVIPAEKPVQVPRLSRQDMLRYLHEVPDDVKPGEPIVFFT